MFFLTRNHFKFKHKSFSMFLIVLSVTICVVGLSSQTEFNTNGTTDLVSIKNDFLKIVGGEKAEEGEFPYQVSLRFRGLIKLHFCGGSIITERIILTAAHCITEVKNPPFSYIEVIAGTTDLKQEGPNVQKSTIMKSVVHPDYPGKVNPFDIALHILNHPFTFNKFVQPVALPKQGEEPVGEGILTGWGSVSRSILPIMPNTLQKVTLPLMNYEECSEWYKKEEININRVSNICTGPTKGRYSACSGDSGGPLVSEYNGTKTIIGIVSWGQVPCGSGSPSVYTKVSSFVDFIQDNISLQ